MAMCTHELAHANELVYELRYFSLEPELHDYFCCVHPPLRVNAYEFEAAI